MSRRRNRAEELAVDPQTAGIPPFIDQWGREVWHNPWGQYRANPRLAATPSPVLRSATGLPVLPLPAPLVAPVAAVTPAAVEVAPVTHRVSDRGRIEADDDRIRATIQYAKGYAKACKELGLEIPAEIQARLRDDLASRRHRVHTRVRRTVAAAAAISAGAVGMNAAAAYFTSSGSGSGSASSGTITVEVSAATGTPSTPLYPGSTGDVTLKLDNPNDVAVTVKMVEGNGTITADAGHSSCSPTGVTFTDATVNTALPANSTDDEIDLPGAASMSTASANGCQGASFTVPVKVTVQEP